MSHPLHILPDRQSTAAANMAYDFLMLQRYETPKAIRFRHYSWTRPAYTFGLSQQFAYVQSEVQDLSADICRRPTGGGVVDHLEDWTYSLVIPATHPLGQGQPIDAYKVIHQCIVDSLNDQGIQAELNTKPPTGKAPSVCFQKSEIYDIVLAGMPAKVAGAAQKRTKAGMLMQGSIWKPTVAEASWAQFNNDITLKLAAAMDATLHYCGWPVWDESEIDTLITQFESEEWNQRR